MAVPLYKHSIEQRPKRIHKAPTYRVTINLKDRPECQAALLDIIRCIKSGYRLPEKYYRANRETTPDALLSQHGVMHLHLEHPGSSELLYLVQFADDVVLLELSDHLHVDMKPPGGILTSLHQLPPVQWSSDLAAERKKSIDKFLRKKR